MVRQNRIDEYFGSNSISQSQLKLLLGSNPILFQTQQEPDLYFEEKEHFNIGDGVDIQLTGSMEDFNEKFHVSNVQNKPSDTLKSIVNQIFDHVKETREEILSIQQYRDAIIDSCNDHEYQMRWNEQTRINKVCECFEYWEDLKASQGKKVLSQEENDKISSIVMSFRTHIYTRDYFIGSINSEIHYQLPIYFNYMGVECRALLDMVRVDHGAKTIQPLDIKTLGDATIYFPKSLRRRRYDIQAAFYHQAIISWALENGYQDYKVLPFKFLVESTTYPGTPLVFTCSNELMSIGRVGREEYLYPESGLSVPEIKGFHQLIEDYKWYMEHGFEIERKIVEAEGEFQMDWNGII